MRLRKAVNEKCKSCTFDEMAMGTGKQQVTLCPVWRCPLFESRPTTERIPVSVLNYHDVDSLESLKQEWKVFAARRALDKGIDPESLCK